MLIRLLDRGWPGILATKYCLDKVGKLAAIPLPTSTSVWSLDNTQHRRGGGVKLKCEMGGAKQSNCLWQLHFHAELTVKSHQPGPCQPKIWVGVPTFLYLDQFMSHISVVCGFIKSHKKCPVCIFTVSVTSTK